MHGNHFLRDEYEISTGRLELSPKESTESFKFPRAKKKGASSPAAKRLGFWRLFTTALITSVLLTVGLIRSIGPANLIKAATVSQVFIAYITPRLMITKRSSTTITNSHSDPSSPGKIVEILPAPLNLVLNLDESAKSENLIKNDPITHVIKPLSTNNTINLFESMAFSWCDTYLKNKRYPTKLTIIASSKVKKCLIGQYRWALKIPKSLIIFRDTNTSSAFNLTCPQNQKDPFDCTSKGRETFRMKYSQKCPDMAPILLACNNRVTLERALAYKPPWAVVSQ